MKWRIYIKIIMTIAYGALYLVSPIPAMISAKDNVVVIAGIAAILVLPAILWYTWKKEVRIVVEKIKSKFAR